MSLLDSLTPLTSLMADWRHDIHRHPELAYKEHRTAKKVAELLRGFGVDKVTEGVGGTGVVAEIRNGDGPLIGLRADMDALPITEHNALPHCSVHDGVMHACGHDGHTTMLLGAARYLAESRNFSGTAVLVFQPAEEGLAGARAMIDDGLFLRWPVGSVYALHNMPGLEAGAISVSPGPVMAAADEIFVTITGKGGHAAAPDIGRDPILAGSAAVMGLQQIVSRNVAPRDTAVISITCFHGGDTFNVTPDEAKLTGTVRFFEPAVGDLMKARIAQVLDGVALSNDVRIDMDYVDGYPPTINTTAEADFGRAVAARVLGEAKAPAQIPRMFAEDFSYMLQEKPGAYGFIGNGDSPSLHNSRYDFNDGILAAGAAWFAGLVEENGR